MEFPEIEEDDTVLCVDMDGTLVRSDLLLEGILLLLKANIFSAFRLLLWLTKGKVYFKRRVAEAVQIDPKLLPFNKEFVAYLREEHRKVRKIALVTASYIDVARIVADYLGIFDKCFATSSDVNLKGSRKADFLEREFGLRNFDYAGDSVVDLPIWSKSRKSILVSSSKGLARRVAEVSELDAVFPGHRITIMNYIKLIRVHQWIKNILIFVPLLAAHRYDEMPLVIDCLIAFFSLSICASATYVFNDLLDINADRQHPHKYRRMLASGDVPITHGIVMIPLLLVVGFGLATFLPTVFSFGLAGYILITTVYSVLLKRVIAIDVFTLTLLFTYRLLLGSMVTLILPSFWLLAFSMFLFLSLAFVKRYSELYVLQRSSGDQAAGRGYEVGDLPTVLAQGIGSGYAATLVMALYIRDPSTYDLYASPQVLWGICIILLYWVTRLWLKCARGEIHNDPIVFAVTDPQSLLAGALAGVIIYLASIPNLYSG